MYNPYFKLIEDKYMLQLRQYTACAAFKQVILLFSYSEYRLLKHFPFLRLIVIKVHFLGVPIQFFFSSNIWFWYQMKAHIFLINPCEMFS